MQNQRPSFPEVDPEVRRSAPDTAAARIWTRGAYWLMYCVAVAATWLHWQSGSYLLAGGAAATAVLGAWCIARER